MHETKSIVLITLLMLLSYTAAQNESSLSTPPPPPPKSNGFSFNPHLRLNPSMAVIIICLISAFFVMGCVSVYIRQCADQQRLLNDLADDDNTGSQRRPRRAVVRGLDPTIIDTFPMFLYSDVKGLKLGKGALECAVCLNEFEGDETLRLLPKCSHVFHPDCIDAWLASHITCPVCRANLIPKPEEIGSCDSLSHHLLSQQSHSVLPQEVSSANDINNLVINIQISSPPAEVINQCQITDHNLPARPARKTPRINDKFRSHSMGHLLVQPGEDCERFTLRLPEEARSQLMKSELSRAKSCVAFPRAISSRKGYRSNSDDIGRAGSKSNYYERFHRDVRSERWGFTVAPPFFSRGSSTRSSKNEVEWEEITVAPRNLFRSVKSPFDRLFGVAEKESNGERSFNRLRAEFSV